MHEWVRIAFDSAAFFLIVGGDWLLDFLDMIPSL